MRAFSLTINEMFAVQQLLSAVSTSVSRDKIGDTCAYRAARNLSTISPLIEDSRKIYIEAIEKQMKEQGIDQSDTSDENKARIEAVRKSVADVVGVEKEEVKLRVLPVAGIAWSGLPENIRVGLIQLNLVEDDEEDGKTIPFKGAEAPQTPTAVESQQN